MLSGKAAIVTDSRSASSAGLDEPRDLSAIRQDEKKLTSRNKSVASCRQKVLFREDAMMKYL